MYLYRIVFLKNTEDQCTLLKSAFVYNVCAHATGICSVEYKPLASMFQNRCSATDYGWFSIYSYRAIKYSIKQNGSV